MELSAVQTRRAAPALEEAGTEKDLYRLCDFTMASLLLPPTQDADSETLFARSSSSSASSSATAALSPDASLAAQVRGSATLQNAVDSLTSIFVEAARVSARAEELSLFLTGECGVGDARAAAVVETYRAKSGELLAVLSRYSADGGPLPELIGVDWDLSFTAKSGDGERYYDPVYKVQFIIRRPTCVSLGADAFIASIKSSSGVRNVDVSVRDRDVFEVRFECGYEDMSSLVDSFSSAITSAELAAKGRI